MSAFDGEPAAGDGRPRTPASAAPPRDDAPMATVLLVGNPNVGKTSLFNRLARRNERVGNYPGVTVERRSAEMPLPSGRRVVVCDVPGAYSLSARSSEEQIALQAILGWAGNPRPDLVIVVVDAGQLVRNLYLALQIIELRVPVAIALNGITFLISAFLVARMRTRGKVGEVEAEASLVERIGLGARAIRGSSEAILLIGLAFAFGLTFGQEVVLYGPLAEDSLGLGIDATGLLFAAPGIGK